MAVGANVHLPRWRRYARGAVGWLGLLSGAAAVVAAMALTAGSVAAAAPPGPGWTVQPTPLIGGASASSLHGVSCWAAGGCLAVGSYVDARGARVSLAEVTSGGRWQREGIPAPAGATSISLTGVACPSAGKCFAVGSATVAAGTVALVEARQGADAWSPVDLPAGGAPLSAVSCSGPRGCVAVGSASSEVWDGTSWRPVAVPMPAGVAQISLDSVSCPAPGGCLAVGKTSGKLSVAYSWNAAVWSPLPDPTTNGAVVAAVSCSSLTACTAVGSTESGAQPLAVRWDGHSWSEQSVPGLRGLYPQFTGVSCPSAASCVAVGDVAPACCAYPLIETWSGGTWRQAAEPSKVNSGLYSGVACVTSNSCAAVGSDFVGTPEMPSAEVPLAVTGGGGSWEMQRTEAPPGPPGGFGASPNSFTGLSCAAAGPCVAVGTITDPNGHPAALTEVSAGGHWSRVPSPGGSLQSVSCASAVSCQAVGTVSATRAQAAELDGNTYTVRTLPVPTSAYNPSPASVSCDAPSSCVAVGTYTAGPSYRPFIDVWDGTSWTAQIPALPSAAGDVHLSGVSCVSSTTCEAVGAAGQVPLAEHWDGSSWSLQTVPTPTAGQGSLLSVSCPTANDCQAVGITGPYPYAPLSEHWNGTTWAVVPTPALASGGQLDSVSCLSRTDCVAVGQVTHTSSAAQPPLAEHWDGSSWTLQTVPLPPPWTYGAFAAVSCVAPGACTAAGVETGLGSHTLIEHHQGA